MKTCCFTGHRIIKVTDKLKQLIVAELTKLIENGISDFYAGGAIGWDMLCEQAVIELRDKSYPHVKLHLILPCCPADQTLKWNENQKRTFFFLYKKADSVEFVTDKYDSRCMKIRNQRLVDLADCCFCYLNSTLYAGGTVQTVRMAAKKGINIINMFDYT